jgi:glutaredoxin
LGQRPGLRPGVLRFTAVAGAVAAVALSSSQTVSAASSSSQANSSTKALDIKLYGYATCPFCNKVGSFLDFFQVPYTLVQVNPIYKDELAFSPDYQKVPIVVLNGERLVDSDCIIDRLNSEVSQQRQTRYIRNDYEFCNAVSFVRVSLRPGFQCFFSLHPPLAGLWKRRTVYSSGVPG